MAFRPQELSVLSYGNGFTRWLYRAPPDEVVTAAGYFDAAAAYLHPGDVIDVVLGAQDRNETARTGSVVVSSVAHGVVTLRPPADLFAEAAQRRAPRESRS